MKDNNSLNSNLGYYLCNFSIILILFSKTANVLFDEIGESYEIIKIILNSYTLISNLSLLSAFLLTIGNSKGWKWSLLYILLFGGDVLYTSIYYPENMEYVEPLYYIFFCYFAFSRVIFSDNISTDYIVRKASKASFLISFVLLICIGMGYFDGKYMWYSDAASLPTAFLLLNGFIGNKKYLYLGIVMSLSILLYGGRGALLSLIVLCFLLAFFNNNDRKAKRKIVYIALVVLPIIYGIMHLFVDTNSSRTLQMLASGDINYDSSRSGIYEVLFYVLSQNPLTGVGFRGDRVALESFMMNESDVAYAHNLFIEILISFGFIVGGCLIIILLYLFYKGLFLNHKISIKDKGFLLSLFAVSVLQLITSRTFLTEINFYILIFLLIKINYISKTKGCFNNYEE